MKNRRSNNNKLVKHKLIRPISTSTLIEVNIVMDTVMAITISIITESILKSTLDSSKNLRLSEESTGSTRRLR
jgi:hypothetical protein